MIALLIACGIGALMVYAVAARPSGRGWAYARLSSLGTGASCAITLGVLPVVATPAAQDAGDGGVLVTAYQVLVGLGTLGVLLWLGLALCITRAAWVQWQLLRAGSVRRESDRVMHVRRAVLQDTGCDSPGR